METQAPPDSLGPGDLRIYNTDSTVDLVLRGQDILAGLSPKMVAQIKAKIDTSTAKDTSGFGAGIASIVKKSVAGAIGTHAVFPISDMRDIRYEDDQIIFEWNDGRKPSIFENANVNGKKASRSFRAEDAQRFIEAVKARKAEMPGACSTRVTFDTYRSVVRRHHLPRRRELIGRQHRERLAIVLVLRLPLCLRRHRHAHHHHRRARRSVPSRAPRSRSCIAVIAESIRACIAFCRASERRAIAASA